MKNPKIFIGMLAAVCSIGFIGFLVNAYSEYDTPEPIPPVAEEPEQVPEISEVEAVQAQQIELELLEKQRQEALEEERQAFVQRTATAWHQLNSIENDINQEQFEEMTPDDVVQTFRNYSSRVKSITVYDIDPELSEVVSDYNVFLEDALEVTTYIVSKRKEIERNPEKAFIDACGRAGTNAQIRGEALFSQVFSCFLNGTVTAGGSAMLEEYQKDQFASEIEVLAIEMTKSQDALNSKLEAMPQYLSSQYGI